MLVETYDDCVIDLTGGDDLYLVAAGIVFERYRDRHLQMHRFNIRNNTIIDADQDGQTIMTASAPTLSVEENVRLYGGEIVYDAFKEGKTFSWDLNDDFKKDVHAMWGICRKDPRLWNTQICVLAAAEKMTGYTDALTVCVPRKYLEEAVERDGGKFITERRILSGLRKCGLLEDYACDDEWFRIAYKNEQVKYCLTVAGQVLEMKIFLAVLDAREKDGTKTYNDAMNGVFIDWDGVRVRNSTVLIPKTRST